MNRLALGRRRNLSTSMNPGIGMQSADSGAKMASSWPVIILLFSETLERALQGKEKKGQETQKADCLKHQHFLSGDLKEALGRM